MSREIIPEPYEGYRSDPDLLRKMGLHGFRASGAVLTFSALGETEHITEVIGRVLLLRQAIDTTCRAVVLCYKEHGDPEDIKAAEKLGIEFLNLEEFIASIKPHIELAG